MGEFKESPLGISWHDSSWIPVLNGTNVMDYFSEKSNPFYDRTCNNEIVKMQRLSPEQLNNMTGLEYILLHVQEPILYVVRKQHRHSQSQVTPITDYYIIAGKVYQAPDLGSVVNSRLLNTVNHLQSAFDECLSYARYHPSKGYTWEFKDKDLDDAAHKKVKNDPPSSFFQRHRVDMLLGNLCKKFPPKMSTTDHQDAPENVPPPPNGTKPPRHQKVEPSENAPVNGVNSGSNQREPKSNETVTIKQEKPDVPDGTFAPTPTPNNGIPPHKMKPPPEKKQKLS